MRQEVQQRALETAIEMTRDGWERPTEAVVKAAKAHGLRPDEVGNVVGWYNTSMIVDRFMADPASRASRHDLADPDAVMAAVGAESLPKAALEIAPPPSVLLGEPDGDQRAESMKRTRLALMFPERAVVPKSAGEKMQELVEEAVASIEAIRDTSDRLLGRIESESGAAHRRLADSIGKMAREIRIRPADMLRKVAQRLANGYADDVWPGLLRAACTMAGREAPTVSKSASHCVMPADPIYLHAADAVSAASARVRLASTADGVRKLATDSFLQDLASQLTANTLGGERGPAFESMFGEMLRDRGSKRTSADGLLSPEFHNKVKALKAKEAFVEALMDNSALRDFDFVSLTDAFNKVTRSNPELVSDPSKLSNFMLHRLNTGGVEDMFTMAQKADVEAKSLDARSKRAKAQLDERKLLDELSAKEARPMGKVTTLGPTGVVKALTDQLASATDKTTGAVGKGLKGMVTAASEAHEAKLKRDAASTLDVAKFDVDSRDKADKKAKDDKREQETAAEKAERKAKEAEREQERKEAIDARTLKDNQANTDRQHAKRSEAVKALAEASESMARFNASRQVLTKPGTKNQVHIDPVRLTHFRFIKNQPAALQEIIAARLVAALNRDPQALVAQFGQGGVDLARALAAAEKYQSGELQSALKRKGPDGGVPPKLDTHNLAANMRAQGINFHASPSNFDYAKLREITDPPKMTTP